MRVGGLVRAFDRLDVGLRRQGFTHLRIDHAAQAVLEHGPGAGAAGGVALIAHGARARRDAGDQSLQAGVPLAVVHPWLPGRVQGAGAFLPERRHHALVRDQVDREPADRVPPPGLVAELDRVPLAVRLLEGQQHAEGVARSDRDRGHAGARQLEILVAVDRDAQQRRQAARGQGRCTVGRGPVRQQQGQFRRCSMGARVEDPSLANGMLQFGVAGDERMASRIDGGRFRPGTVEVLRPEVKGVARPIAVENKHRGGVIRVIALGIEPRT